MRKCLLCRQADRPSDIKINIKITGAGCSFAHLIKLNSFSSSFRYFKKTAVSQTPSNYFHVSFTSKREKLKSCVGSALTEEHKVSRYCCWPTCSSSDTPQTTLDVTFDSHIWPSQLNKTFLWAHILLTSIVGLRQSGGFFMVHRRFLLWWTRLNWK